MLTGLCQQKFKKVMCVKKNWLSKDLKKISWVIIGFVFLSLCVGQPSQKPGQTVPAPGSSPTPTYDIKVNEVLYYENTGGIEAERRHEWVELYNAGSRDISLKEWRLTARDGKPIALLPDIILPTGAYLVVHFTTGKDDLDFSNGKGDYYTQTTNSVFSDTMDEVALYTGMPSDMTIEDFICWEGTERQFTGGTAHQYAVDAKIWTHGTYFDALNSQPIPTYKRKTVYAGESIGRDKDSIDTNAPSDWDVKGGQDAIDYTPRERNYHPLNMQIVPPPPQPPPQLTEEWTFMVYIDGDNNLEKFVYTDMNEMEMAPTSDEINIVVMVDGFNKFQGVDRLGKSIPGRKGGAWRFQLKNDTNKKAVYMHPTPDDWNNGTYYRGEPNMGDPATLREFAQWGITNFPADKYALIIWDHGNGWKAVAVDSSSGGDMIHMGELRSALTGVSVDLIGFDACLMAMIEVGYQVKESAEVMVASEEIEDGDGWPYDTILTELVRNPRMDEKELGKLIVEKYHEFYEKIIPKYNNGVPLMEQRDPYHTLSAIDLRTEYDALVNDVSAFGTEMMTGIEDYDAHYNPNDNEQMEIKKAREGTEEYLDTNYIDLYDLAEKVERSPLKPPYKASTDDIKRRLRTPGRGGLIIIAERHGPGHPNSHGLSIYFPRFQTKDFQGQPFDDPWPSFKDKAGSPQVIYAEDFTTEWGKVPYIGLPPHPLEETPHFLFPRDTQWDEFLHRYYKPVADAGEDRTYQCGDIVTLNGKGSSDSDGEIKKWIWDLHSNRDEPTLLPGPTEDCSSTGDDCECDRSDETDDDLELEGETVTFTCEEPIYYITLTVHDDHNSQHNNHWKTDKDTVVIKCEECKNGNGNGNGEENGGEKPILQGISSTFTIMEDVVELEIHIVSEELSYLIYDVEILPEDQGALWEGVEGLEAPEGWEFEKINNNGVKFYTKVNPLISCQPLRFTFRVYAEEILPYINVHLTDENHENTGMISSILVEKESPPEEIPSYFMNCVQTLAEETAMEHREEFTDEQIEEMLKKPESEYVEQMIYDLNRYIESREIQVTEEIRECAERLLEYLYVITPEQQQQIAMMYWGIYKATLSS